MITTYLNTARKKIQNLFLFDRHSKSQILCHNIRGIRKFTTKIGGIKLERHVIGTCSRRKKKKRCTILISNIKLAWSMKANKLWKTLESQNLKSKHCLQTGIVDYIPFLHMPVHSKHTSYLPNTFKVSTKTVQKKILAKYRQNLL